MGNEAGLYTSPWCYLETPLRGASIETHKPLYIEEISNVKEMMLEEWCYVLVAFRERDLFIDVIKSVK